MAQHRMNRRSWCFPKLCAAACLTVALALYGCHASTRAPAEASKSVPENLLLITIDTLRPDHLGCYGDRSIKTPNIDDLAAHGIRFAQAVAAVPLTLPSHASILTGTYPPVHGVRDMGGFVLGDSPPTLATVLAKAGFRTAAFVGSFTLDHRFGLNRGFETYDDDMPPAGTASASVREPERRAEVVADRALAWLAARPPGRFFLWVHFFDPHTPYDPPEPYRSQYAGRLYDGEIAYTDAQLGRLLEALRQKGLAERTLIALLGDHGESLGEHGESTHGIFLYDATVRIPLILAGPGVPAGKTVEAQVRSIDLMPTILAALRLPPGHELQGTSLWPVMKGGTTLPPESRFAYLETIYPRTHLAWSELRGLRTAEWKYIQAPHEELYDLRVDSAEEHNGLRKNPAVLERYKAVLGGILGESRRDEVLRAGQLSEEARQELDSLGYVSAGLGQPVKLDMSRPDPKTRVALLHNFETAIDLMGRRDYALAAEWLEKAVAADSTNPLFYLRLGICYQVAGNAHAALATFERAFRHHAETDEIMYRYGNLLSDEGEFKRAAVAFERSLTLNPGFSEALNNLALCYWELGRLAEAESAFKRLLALNAKQASAHNGLGLVRIKQGRRAEAAAEFQQALGADPQFWEAWLNLGIYYREEGRREEALRCLEKFTQGAPPSRYEASIHEAREMMANLRAGWR